MVMTCLLSKLRPLGLSGILSYEYLKACLAPLILVKKALNKLLNLSCHKPIFAIKISVNYE